MSKPYKGFKGSGMRPYAPATHRLDPKMFAKLMSLSLRARCEHAVQAVEAAEKREDYLNENRTEE